MDLDIAWSYCGSQIFYHGILQSAHKMVIFLYFFCKIVPL